MALQIHSQHPSIAIDTDTGLMWQRFSVGQRFENGRVTGNAERINFNDALEAASECNYLGFSDWRVPTIKELRDPKFIKNNILFGEKSYYWSCSRINDDTYYAWVADFSTGYCTITLKGDNCFIRLVHNNV